MYSQHPQIARRWSKEGGSNSNAAQPPTKSLQPVGQEKPSGDSTGGNPRVAAMYRKMNQYRNQNNLNQTQKQFRNLNTLKQTQENLKSNTRRVT